MADENDDDQEPFELDAATVEGIRRGLEDMRVGRGRPLTEFEAEFRAKYDIPVDGDDADSTDDDPVDPTSP